MAKQLLKSPIDIYQYPAVFENQAPAITLGDLHGNTVKLLHFLLRHQILCFKESVQNPNEAYQHFVTLYNKTGAIILRYNDNASIIKEQIEEKKAIEQQLQSQAVLYSSQVTPPPPDEKLETLRHESKELATFIQEDETKQESLLKTLQLHIEQFHEFLEQLQVKDKNTAIRLIGDELADRGSNDYFTLKIFKLLHQQQVRLHIVLSNHGVEFIRAYELESFQPVKAQNVIADTQKASLMGLKFFLDHHLISKSNLLALINTTYKSTLKLLDYTISHEGITLYTHAPVRFDTLAKIARRLGVVYLDQNKEALGLTIDKINTKFAEIVTKNEVHTLYHKGQINQLSQMSADEINRFPLSYLIWNRWDKDKETLNARPSVIHGYTCHYVHGHDDYITPLPHIYNLDTVSGKGPHQAQTSNSLFDERVLTSDEEGLNQIHDLALIDEEYRQYEKIPPLISSLMIGGVLGLSSFGFNPFGLSIFEMLCYNFMLTAIVLIITTLSAPKPIQSTFMKKSLKEIPHHAQASIVEDPLSDADDPNAPRGLGRLP